MKHLDWLHPNHIILANPQTSTSYKEFTKDMRSRDYSDLRLLEFSGETKIRYQIQGKIKWYDVNILQRRGKDYYLEILLLFPIEFMENDFKTLNRQEKINSLLDDTH